MTAQPTLSVVVLAFNEAECIEETVEELLGEIRRLGVTAEVVIVDDGSTDTTGEIADGLAARYAQVRVVHHARNLGLGGVYRTGFAEARGEHVTFFPADGQFPASILADFVSRSGEADLVLGYLPEARPSLVGRCLSAGERLLYRMLLGPIPRFQGVLLVRRAVLREIPLVSRGRGWGVLMEMIVRVARGPYRVVSVPTPIRPRLKGRSKVQNARTILSNLKQLVELRLALGGAATKGCGRPGNGGPGGCGTGPGRDGQTVQAGPGRRPPVAGDVSRSRGKGTG